MNNPKHARPAVLRAGDWARRRWKHVAIGAVVLFVLASVGRSMLPALGISAPGTGGGGGQGAQPTSRARSTPPPKADLGGVLVPGGGQPLVMLNPGLVRPGTKVGINGSGFDPGARVEVSLEAGKSAKAKRVATATAAKDGSITASFQFPEAAASSATKYVVTAQQRGSDKSGTAEVAVAQGVGRATLEEETGKPGDTVTLSASGFSPSEELAVYWGRTTGEPSATVRADSGGGVGQASVKVGVAATGDTALVVVGKKSGIAASVPFQVLGLYPTVTVKPYAVKAAQPVTFSGKGFAPGERILVRLNSAGGQPVMAVPADAGGSFSGAGFTVPYSLTGKQALILVGEQSRASVNAGFTILPYQPNVRASMYGGMPGSSLTFYAQGFAPDEAVHVYVGRSKGGGGKLVSAFRVDRKGTAGSAGSYTIPGDAPNQVTFSLLGARSGATADVTVKVDKSGGSVNVPPPPPYKLPKDLEK